MYGGDFFEMLYMTDIYSPSIDRTGGTSNNGDECTVSLLPDRFSIDYLSDGSPIIAIYLNNLRLTKFDLTKASGIVQFETLSNAQVIVYSETYEKTIRNNLNVYVSVNGQREDEYVDLEFNVSTKEGETMSCILKAPNRSFGLSGKKFYDNFQ